ncbi:MAG: 30S ribosomal protein S12 methylthiotransferase RimO [Candidatus Melainabacteria bacterium]|nr:30S ribosomal protein S12 methylthiotransferase RimO [Candidatus Melainabacteria bacterium]
MPAITENSVAKPEKNAHKISFVHLGCPKNLVDTETMLGLLEKDGHQIVASDAEADLVMVNTCAFVEAAQKESVECLVALAERGKKLLITGCLAQKFQGELLELFPEAQAVVGIDHVADIAGIVSRTRQGERVLATQQDPTFILTEDRVRRHVASGASVYVKISEGCDYRCTFCIIPSMRGSLRSRSVANVVENVKHLVDQGVTEVVLVGQDNTSYGRDTGEDLPTLLEALNNVDGLTWLRFMYAYPNDRLNQRLLETIRDCDKVVKYLDCPLQHTHPDILKRMNRPLIDTADYVAWIRQTVPGIRLRTTLIVGFPGETETHFQHMEETARQVRWDRLGVFEYSDVDTAASQRLDGKVAKQVAKDRRKRLMALQQPIAFELNQQLVGRTLPVIVDELRPSGVLVGRTQWDAPEVDNAVILRNPKGVAVHPGEVVAAQVTSATPYDLKATVLPEEAPGLSTGL